MVLVLIQKIYVNGLKQRHNRRRKSDLVSRLRTAVANAKFNKEEDVITLSTKKE